MSVQGVTHSLPAISHRDNVHNRFEHRLERMAEKHPEIASALLDKAQDLSAAEIDVVSNKVATAADRMTTRIANRMDSIEARYTVRIEAALDAGRMHAADNMLGREIAMLETLQEHSADIAQRVSQLQDALQVLAEEHESTPEEPHVDTSV